MESGDVGGLAYHYMQNLQLPAILVQEVCMVNGSTKL
jgi:hypothetical protein